MLQRQRFSQNFSSTHEAICRCDVSPRHVAATCRQVCTDLYIPDEGAKLYVIDGERYKGNNKNNKSYNYSNHNNNNYMVANQMGR